MKPKGSFEYIKSRRTYTTIRTILYFAISASIFIAGYLTTHTKANLLTIIAVLGVLPASKSAVEAIMLYRARPVPDELHSECEGVLNKLKDVDRPLLLYGLYLTSYDRSFPLDVTALGNSRVWALPHGVFTGSIAKGFDKKACEDHIRAILKSEGYGDKSIGVKVFTDYESYMEALLDFSSVDKERAEALSACLKRASV